MVTCQSVWLDSQSRLPGTGHEAIPRLVGRGTTMNRDTFLERVRLATVQGRTHRIQHQPLADDAGYVGTNGDLVEALATEINVVGGHATVVENTAEAQQILASILAAANVRHALTWQHANLDALNLQAVLSEQDITSIDYSTLSKLPRAEQRQQVFNVDVGVTAVDFAVAETGSLMLWSKPGSERLASLVPPTHIAVVFAEQIVPDLFDAVAQLDASPENMPSNVTFITGPSKTGDIELELTTGVHGPKNWHVIVVRNAT